MSDADVLFETRGNIGLMTLNRPKVLNSLNHNMCVMIKEKLDEWAVDDAVQAVIVVGAGEKAFCAGGDVVMVTTSGKEGTTEWQDFFRDEYIMNIAIDTFPKPFISLVDGFVMGGGVGVSIPGDFWVATEKTMFAMPETGIGLFPDVGGGWFLPRLPGEVGMYLALTGARMKAADLFAVGIADTVIDSGDVEAVIDALAGTQINCNNCVKPVLAKFHKDPGTAPLAPYMDQIDEHFAGFSVDDIIRGLKVDESEWAAKQVKTLSRMSPTSMLVTFEQLRRGEGLETFRDNMIMEFRIASHMMEGNDFYEGVRALLVDKDNSPAWSPANLDDVPDSDVQAYFAPLGDGKELPV